MCCRAAKSVRYWQLDAASEEFNIGGFAVLSSQHTCCSWAISAVAMDGAILVLIDLKKGQVVKKMQLAKSYSDHGVAISPDASQVVVSEMYVLCMWGIATAGNTRRSRNGRFSGRPLSRRMANTSFAGNQKVNLWEVASSRRSRSSTDPAPAMCSAWPIHPTGTHFAAIPGAAGQTLRVFRLPAEVAE